MLHEVHHVEDSRVTSQAFGQGKHEPRDKLEEDALLCGEVGAQEAGKEIVKGLDHAGRNLLSRRLVIAGRTGTVHIKDIEGRRMIDVSRVDKNKPVRDPVQFGEFAN